MTTESEVALIDAAADLLKTDVSKPGIDEELQATRVVAARFLRARFNESIPDIFRVPVLGTNVFDKRAIS